MLAWCRLFAVNSTYGDASGDTGNWLTGNASAADLLRFQGSMTHPMLHAPGAQYCYVNTNFNIAAYVVERVSDASPAISQRDAVVKMLPNGVLSSSINAAVIHFSSEAMHSSHCESISGLNEQFPWPIQGVLHAADQLDI